MEHVNDWCFRDIYNGGLRDDDLHVCALKGDRVYNCAGCYGYFRLDHGRPNIRQEFALKLRVTLKHSNDSSLDSSIPYETLAQLETFILWNPGSDWLPLPVLWVDQSVMLFLKSYVAHMLYTNV